MISKIKAIQPQIQEQSSFLETVKASMNKENLFELMELAGYFSIIMGASAFSCAVSSTGVDDPAAIKAFMDSGAFTFGGIAAVATGLIAPRVFNTNKEKLNTNNENQTLSSSMKM